VVPSAAPARFEEVSAEKFYGSGYDDTAERIPDIRKARRLLGWEPKRSMNDMLPGIVRDYVNRYSDRIVASQTRSA
jgi:nucleoside-diphosphate-sugar epimerase